MKKYHRYLYSLELQFLKSVPKEKKKLFILLAIFRLLKEHKYWACKHRKLSFFMNVKEIPDSSPLDKSKFFVKKVSAYWRNFLKSYFKLF